MTNSDFSNLKNIFFLSICFALSASTSSLTVTASSLVGFEISSNQSFATLPLSFHLIGTMLAGLPASLLMKSIGRKYGFIIGTLIGSSGAISASLSIIYKNFSLFCFSVFCLGILSGFTQLYRFTAADVATKDFRTKAVSLVMLGGILAGFIGPAVASKGEKLISNAPFAGSYSLMFFFHLLVIIILIMIRLPQPSIEEKTGEIRGIKTIFFQPKFIVAVLSSMMSYAVMAMIMTATPLTMTEYCGHRVEDAAFVIQWHIVGMFAPSFFTGSLIKRFGAVSIIITGILLNLLCIGINFTGTDLLNFWCSLFLLGVGWNFMFLAGTTMVTETYLPAEKAIVQGVNDFLVFGSAAIASLFAGILQTSFGWEALNLTAILLLGVVAIALLLNPHVFSNTSRLTKVQLESSS